MSRAIIGSRNTSKTILSGVRRSGPGKFVVSLGFQPRMRFGFA